MTNLQASVVNSQLRRLDKIAARKKEILNQYKDHINADLIWQEVPDKGVHSYWMISVRSWEPDWYKRASKYLADKGIETRPIFPPIHQMPAIPWANDAGSPNVPHCPNAEWLYNSGITLPSGPALTDEEISYICKSVGEIV
jgi:perosamine synthetase